MVLSAETRVEARGVRASQGAPVHAAVDALPRLVAFGLAGLGVVGTPLLLLHRFDPVPVLAGTAAVLVLLELTWRRSVPAPPRATRRTAVVSVLALLVAVASAALNATAASQHLLVDGDPAVYAVTGQLIAETGSLQIDTLHDTVFGAVPTLNHAGAGFDASADQAVVRPSFMHLLPEALAVASWVGGPAALLVTNAALGGFALLAVFAFGARLVRPEWSLLATTALALTLPQQHFSRDTFSEIPAQLLVFAGLVLLYDVVAGRRVATFAARSGIVAGAVLGTSCIVRIDAFFYLVPLTALVAVLALAGAARTAVAVAVGAGVPAAIGYADLRLGSASYLGLQAANLRLIFAALAATVVLAVVLVTLRGRSLALWERVRGPALAGAVAVLLLALSAYAGLLRPALETGRHLSATQPTAVASLQKAAGLAVDPLRSYDELSLRWLSWYLGPLAVALGLLGFAVMVHRSLVRHRRGSDAEASLAALAFLLLFGASTALYLWRPSIIPVQYWATRRFLPVTVPGLLLCAAWVGALVSTRRWRRLPAVLVAAALLLPPLAFLRGHVGEREYVPLRAAVERVCAALGPDDAVVLVGGDRAATGLPQTVHAFCGVPVAVVSGATTRSDLSRVQASAAASGRRLVYLSSVPDPAVSDGPVPGEVTPVVDVPVSVVALSLTGRPDQRFAFRLALYLVRPSVGAS